MSGGKKKKSSSTGNKKKSQQKEPAKEAESTSVTSLTENTNTSNTASTTSKNIPTSTTTSNSPDNTCDAFGSNPSVDVLDRLAPPILFFPPNVAEEYLARFCPAPAPATSPVISLLAEEGFPDREIPVMRRLLAMMAGIMSKASAASARTYYSRVAGTEGRRNGYFQQNLNTSVFNLFSTLSAAGNTETNSTVQSDLHLKPAAAFTAKDGEPLRGYPTRLMKFWRQLSAAEQLRLVKEEHAALTNSWIESRQNWCLCAHCKHRRMTISDLTDCLYQTYCEELEAFLNSGGQGSTLYSPNLANSMDASAKARRFLFKSLSVVGEQALLPRFNQFILRLEAFSSMAFSLKEEKKLKIPCELKNGIKNGLKSAALQASKEFLQRHGKNSIEIEEFMSENFTFENNPLEGLSFKMIQDSEDEDEEEDIVEIKNRNDDYSSDEDGESHQGGIQSEDDDDLIDDETDLPIDESELMLPGGSSFPLLPAGDGPVQWSESSRIECGRTVFLMFASEMFQYRLTAAHLAHQTKLRQQKLLEEVEAEERLEREQKAKAERIKKEKEEAERKKKAAKKEKAAAKANGPGKQKQQKQQNQSNQSNQNLPAKPTKVESVEVGKGVEVVEGVIIEESIGGSVVVSESPIELVSSIITSDPITIETEPITVVTEPTEPITTTTPITSTSTSKPDDDDDFDPTLLVEQLSKEMNRFELHSTSPPGFAPPPGFPAEPKHLPLIGEGVEYQYSGRPPFDVFDYDMFMPKQEQTYQYQQQYNYNYQQQQYQNNYNPQYQQQYHQNYHQFYPPHTHMHNPAAPAMGPPPSKHQQQQDDNEGQSRFQSFFSKSIFGPSSFFSQ